MPKVIPSLFKLAGAGFINDEYAADGNHLRWQFDPRLGFPRTAFCLERRPAIGTKDGFASLKVHSYSFSRKDDDNSRSINHSFFKAQFQPSANIQTEQRGTILDQSPFVIDFTQGTQAISDHAVCYAKLTFNVAIPGGWIDVKSIYNNQDEDEIIEQARRNFVLRPIQGELARNLIKLPRSLQAYRKTLEQSLPILDRLSKPPRSLGRPLNLRDPNEILLFSKYRTANPRLYRSTSASFIKEMVTEIKQAGLDITQLKPFVGFYQTVELTMRADQIDKLQITGEHAFLSGIVFVHTEHLMNAKDWQTVDCYPIITREANYVENNIMLNNLSMEQWIERRTFSPKPNGVEPLDEPQVPPQRPPTFDEYQRRYMQPYQTRLESWVQKILSDSQTQNLHQSEIVIKEKLDDVGQKANAGTSSQAQKLLKEQTMQLQPYELLLAAASRFPMARLLGLATVDQDGIDKTQRWDYRVKGRWDYQDILNWPRKLIRELAALQAQKRDASVADAAQLDIEILEKTFEITQAQLFVTILLPLSGQTNNKQQTVDLYALKMDVGLQSHNRFNPPPTVIAEEEGLGIPQGAALPNGIARISWTSRQRSRAAIQESIPVNACVVRGDEGNNGQFDRWLNSIDQHSGATVAIIPGETENGLHHVFDNTIKSGESYRYGVSEADIFNRWSAFKTTQFDWEYTIPPIAPKQITAELEEVIGNDDLILNVSFRWPRQLAVQSHRFDVNFLYQTPNRFNEIRQDRNTWGHCGNSHNNNARHPAFVFASNSRGNFNHGGMNIHIDFIDDADGRTYHLRFDDVSLLRDANDIGKIHVAIGTTDQRNIQSDEVGGPAIAEHAPATPPTLPVIPPAPALASYADAEGLSSYTLKWTAQPNRQYEVFRAGERELISYLESNNIDLGDYASDEADNRRADSLKRLAIRARDVFQVRSPRLTTSEYRDQLPGQLRTLTVYTVLARSPSGILSEWPTNGGQFVAVAVPHAPEPMQPSILQAAWQAPVNPLPTPPQAGMARNEILIAQPSSDSADIVTYEVYRTNDPNKAKDYRQMQPLHKLNNPAYDVPVNEVMATRYIDPHIQAWTTYYYSVVGRSANPNDSTQAGMRSTASNPIKVNSHSATPPPQAVITGIQNGALSFEVALTALPFGSYTFTLHEAEDLGMTQNKRRLLQSSSNNLSHTPPDTWMIEVGNLGLNQNRFISITIKDPLGNQSESLPRKVSDL